MFDGACGVVRRVTWAPICAVLHLPLASNIETPPVRELEFWSNISDLTLLSVQSSSSPSTDPGERSIDREVLSYRSCQGLRLCKWCTWYGVHRAVDRGTVEITWGMWVILLEVNRVSTSLVFHSHKQIMRAKYWWWSWVSTGHVGSLS